MHDYLSICLVIYLSIILIASNTLPKKKNRQEVQNQPYTCPADREGLDRDKVNNFHLPSNLLQALCFGLVYCEQSRSKQAARGDKISFFFKLLKQENHLTRIHSSYEIEEKLSSKSQGHLCTELFSNVSVLTRLPQSHIP